MENTTREGFRIERDTLGEVRVPASALYGAQTQRAVENFPISQRRFSRAFIRALGLVKAVAASVNGRLGVLPLDLAAAIESAAEEVARGEHDDQFVVMFSKPAAGHPQTRMPMRLSGILLGRIRTTTSIAANRATTFFQPPFTLRPLSRAQRTHPSDGGAAFDADPQGG